MINILDEKTINRIAAGEVVERPVSVVKELVENAIDSGAANISVEIKGGGIDLIRVTDNGSGIDKASIPSAFLRHATSKIKDFYDLRNISTLGFRGEALSSVAAVAQVELLTKCRDDFLGYRYRIEGGKEISFDEAGLPDGTTVIVRNLFYNTPARKKFLKSAVSEANLITTLIERLILSHPGIGFKYTVNGTLRLSSDGLGDIKSDIYTVFGRNVERCITEVSLLNENCTVTGYAGKPEIGRGNRDCEIFFVNGRLIKSSLLSSAVEEAYHNFLMLHRFPFIILYIEIPAELLDVNVHPAKTQVRFADERTVYSLVTDAVYEAVTKEELIPDAAASSNPVSEASFPEASKAVKAANAVYVPEPFEQRAVTVFQKEAEQSLEETRAKQSAEQITLFKEGFLDDSNIEKHRIIGQLFDTYWLIEFEEKLYIIDQHAAHEKIKYEHLIEQIKGGRVDSQLISPPYILSLSVSQEETLLAHMEDFSHTGFAIEHFGGREYAVTAVPVELFGMGEKDYLISVIDELASSGNIKEPAAVYDRIATMSCKAAIKGNTHITYEEAKSLIGQLLKLENPYNCPHGRPTMVMFSKTEIEKMFKRIV